MFIVIVDCFKGINICSETIYLDKYYYTGMVIRSMRSKLADTP